MTTEPTFYWHIHHEILIEETFNIQERIDYIKEGKPEDAIRGTSAPVIIRAPSSTSAFRKAVSFIRTRTDYLSYEPRVTRL